MGHIVTPSPTPSVDGLLTSVPPFVDEASNHPTQSMNGSRHGHWSYGTPPLEEDGLHDYESLFGSRHDASLVSVALSGHWLHARQSK